MVSNGKGPDKAWLPREHSHEQEGLEMDEKKRRFFHLKEKLPAS